MSQSMNIWEKIIDKRIRKEMSVTKNQFGFMPRKSTVERLFCVRQLAEKYKEKQNVFIVFIDLMKEYYKVPREV